MVPPRSTARSLSAPPSRRTWRAWCSTAWYGSPAYGYGAPAKTNTLAIVSLIASISGFVIFFVVGSIVGVITGRMALSQLKTSEQGRGLALAARSSAGSASGSLLGIIGFFLFFAFVASMSTSYSC